ncbi:tup1-general transcription repressor [Malassezia pachydermatis]|uniref:Tup1-general transcription repressor n=1 Tax=Malassezia pachydermatis TaxID=77020 RepID=A0A0M9VQK0_9BASI|nr:tup1-general transcription repressor [Malassezia pachydermatis]KOS15602.1 tup1-general transcription repressor [Malassezia pachydermatis]
MPTSPPPPPGAHPLSAGGVAPPASQAMWSARLMDLLNLVRHEFEVIGNDAVHFKSQRDELENRIAQQYNEVSLMQEHIYELEKRHYEIVGHYEDEIKRLRLLLDGRNGPPRHEGPSTHAPPPHLPEHSMRSGPMTAMPPGMSERDMRERMMPAEPPRSENGHVPGESGWPPAKRMKSNNAPNVLHELPHLKREDREAKRSAAETMAAKESLAPSRSEPSATQDTNKDDAALSSTPAADMPNEAPPKATDASEEKAQEAFEPAESAMQEIKKEGSDWVAVYNPHVPQVLDIDLVHTLAHESVVCCVRFSPDGKWVATGCNRCAQIYNTETGERTCVLQDEAPQDQGDLYIRSICFSPDGKYLATGAEDRLIRIWDIAERKIKMQLTGHKQEIYSLEYSKDGKMLVSGSGDKTVRLWDAETGNVLHVLYTSPGLNYGPGVTTVTISPDGSLVAAGALDTFVRVWETKTGKLLCRLKGHKDSIYSVSFMPDGQFLVSGSLDKTLKLWDLSSVIKEQNSIDEEITNPSLCTATFSGHKDYVLSVSCSPHGRWIASSSKDRCVQLWDPKTAQSQFVLQGHKNSVIAICMSQTNNLLATGSGDFNARIWSYKEK